MDKSYQNGTRLLRPRLSTYRKLIKLSALTITFVGLVFTNATPSLALTSSVSDLLDSAQPVAPVSPLIGLTAKANLPKADNTPAPKATDAARPAPEISAEITAAEYVPPAPPAPVTNIRVGGYVSAGSNNFPYGYCTYYVAQKRAVNWGGNAREWYGNAQATGHTVGSAPRVGAIMVTSESYYGHVAYVESVNPNGSFTVSEMNYAGWEVVNYRTISAGSVPLIGFIY